MTFSSLYGLLLILRSLVGGVSSGQVVVIVVVVSSERGRLFISAPSVSSCSRADVRSVPSDDCSPLLSRDELFGDG